MLQRLPIALAQKKAGNLSKNLFNEIKQKKLLRKYITILWFNKGIIYKMNIIFMDFESIKTSDRHRHSSTL